MKKIDIILSETYSHSDIDDLKGFSNSELLIKPEYIKRYPASGGIGWEGIVIFMTGAVFTGLIESLGQDVYKKFKELLFRKKEKLNKGKEKFTINITLEKPGIVFFDLTNVDRKNFDDAFDSIKNTIINPPRY